MDDVTVKVTIECSNKTDSGKINDQYSYEFSMLEGTIEETNFNKGGLILFEGDQLISKVTIDNIRSGDNITINKEDLLLNSKVNPDDFHIDYLHISFS